ncbi:MAG: hypothetical protein WDN46_09285 [Methylocella sp.]
MSDHPLRLSEPSLAPPHPMAITIDVTEFIALRTIVMALATIMAVELEQAGGATAQSWINGIAEICADAILESEMTVPDGRNVESMRRRAIDHLNAILGGIRFPSASQGN